MCGQYVEMVVDHPVEATIVYVNMLIVFVWVGKFGPGQDASQQLTPVDAIDQGSILVRAMFAMNPTPQLRRILEAYNEEGR